MCPEPTATALPVPTATALHEPTATALREPTARALGLVEPAVAMAEPEASQIRASVAMVRPEPMGMAEPEPMVLSSHEMCC